MAQAPHQGNRPPGNRPPPSKRIEVETEPSYEDNGESKTPIKVKVILGNQSIDKTMVRVFQGALFLYEKLTDDHGEWLYEHVVSVGYTPGEKITLTYSLSKTESAIEKRVVITLAGAPIVAPVPARSNKSVKLTAGLPVKNGDNFETNVLAQVLENDVSMKDVDVRLFFDSAEVHLGRSDDSGKLSHLLTIPARFAGQTVPLKAQLTGADAAKEKEISVIVPEIKAPAQPQKPQARYAEIEEHGADGNYYLTIQVLDENEKGAVFPLVLTEKCFAVRNTILPNNQNPHRMNTDPTGYVVIQLANFNEKKRIIHVQVEGSKIDREIVLEGPKPPTFKGQLDPAGGFWKNLFQ